MSTLEGLHPDALHRRVETVSMARLPRAERDFIMHEYGHGGKSASNPRTRSCIEGNTNGSCTKVSCDGFGCLVYLLGRFSVVCIRASKNRFVHTWKAVEVSLPCHVALLR